MIALILMINLSTCLTGEMMSFIEMNEITQKDYEKFFKKHKEVNIGSTNVKLQGEWDISEYGPTEDYKNEQETVWSFPDRGNWATHKGNYRGNWSPYIPRNLILKYSRKGDIVLDQMVGSGTTLIECKLLNRNAIGVDVNYDAIMVCCDRLNFNYSSNQGNKLEIKTYVGDARKLDKIKSESIDLITTHPPYARIITYTKQRTEGDLSSLSIRKYIEEMQKVAEESIRVLKPNRYCAILVGDTRRSRHYVPIAYRIMQKFLDAGFILKEDIIKRQWKMKGTREKWRRKENDFFLIAHEHLFVFRKPDRKEELLKFKNSMTPS